MEEDTFGVMPEIGSPPGRILRGEGAHEVLEVKREEGRLDFDGGPGRLWGDDETWGDDMGSRNLRRGRRRCRKVQDVTNGSVGMSVG